MKTPKLTTSFAKYSDSALESKAESVVLACDGNSFFTKPNPTMAAIREAIVALSDAIAAAADGSRIKIAERKQARKVLEDLLRQLIAYVTMVANGDETILISSALDMYKEPETKPEIVSPQPPELSSGNNDGEVWVSVLRMNGARNYMYECTPDPLTDSSVWEQSFNTRIKCLITGLQPGKKYWFRVTVIGLSGAKAQSKAVAYFVQ